MYGTPEGWSQATNRSYRVYEDQHGRQWGADVENATQAPCGPISARFKSPLRIAQKYVRLIDAHRGVIHIDYEAWLHDLREAHTEYLHHMRQQKIRMSPATPHSIDDDDPNLLLAVGDPPPALQQVLAARAGNRWVLGLENPETKLPEEKPRWAEEYFPTPPEEIVLEFPSFDEELGFLDDDDDEREPMSEPDTSSEGVTVEDPALQTMKAPQLTGEAPPGLDPSWTPPEEE